MNLQDADGFLETKIREFHIGEYRAPTLIDKKSIPEKKVVPSISKSEFSDIPEENLSKKSTTIKKESLKRSILSPKVAKKGVTLPKKKTTPPKKSTVKTTKTTKTTSTKAPGKVQTARETTTSIKASAQTPDTGMLTGIIGIACAGI